MSKYNDFLKNHETYDKFILFLLSLDKGEYAGQFKPDKVAKMCEVTRQTVYNVMERNKAVYEEFIKPEVAKPE